MISKSLPLKLLLLFFVFSGTPAREAFPAEKVFEKTQSFNPVADGDNTSDLELQTKIELHFKNRDFLELQKTFDQILDDRKDSLFNASHAVLLYRSALGLENQGDFARSYRYFKAAVLTDMQLLESAENDFIRRIFSWAERSGDKQAVLFHKVFSAFVDGENSIVHKHIKDLEDIAVRPEIFSDLSRIKKMLQKIEVQQLAFENALKDKAPSMDNYDDLPIIMPVSGLSASQTMEIMRIKDRIQEKQMDHMALLSGGWQLYSLGDHDGALACFERVLQLKPELPEANYRIARLMRKTARISDAVMYVVKAVSANSGETRYRGFYALLLADQMEFIRAEAEALAVIKLNALNGDARLALARCFFHAEDIDNALKHIEMGIRLNDSETIGELMSLKARINEKAAPRSEGR